MLTVECEYPGGTRIFFAFRRFYRGEEVQAGTVAFLQEKQRSAMMDFVNFWIKAEMFVSGSFGKLAAQTSGLNDYQIVAQPGFFENVLVRRVSQADVEIVVWQSPAIEKIDHIGSGFARLVAHLSFSAERQGLGSCIEGKCICVMRKIDIDGNSHL